MRETRHRAAGWPPGARVGLTALTATLLAAGSAYAQCTTSNTVTAQVVALDQTIFYNRLGAHDPTAMIFALKNDVVPSSGTTLSAGNVRLRDGKRPRPLTLRVNAGGCLQVTFTNYLSPTARSNQPGTRAASLHASGMQLVNSIADDGSNVGQNATSLVEPGYSRTYKWFAEKEGTYLLYSTAQTTGGDGDGGQISKGLFGAINVEPVGSEWYRSQVTAAELALAQARNSAGTPISTAAGHPVINYDAVYPTGHPLAGRTILKMVQNGQIVHADLTAIIAGPNKGLIPTQYDSVRVARARHKPFREMTIIFHDEPGLVQAFDPIFEDPKLEFTLHSGRDAFAINYGTGGIGAEVIANRLGVGPMWDCNECKYEEFFLTSWAVGDPAMVVDVPADADRNGDGQPDAGKKATKAFFPDDPSNVYHSYMNDHLKIRNLHAGPKEHHIFHLHAHQWLHTPNSDNSTYLDSQSIGPGAGFTYEITYDGSSNRNKTVGDAIFHCHFYPHFAQGMWALWRVHDVFEKGTALDADGTPAAGARALPDGEIAEGTPIPGLVPMPTYALAPMPTTTMPGFPFYIPGVAGHRPPKPPLDTKFDGGLPRHVVTDGTASFPALNRLDFHKDNVTIVAQALPETGTAAEVNAMNFHAKRSQPTYRFDPLTFSVVADTFITNGRPGVAGAPFADPCINDLGQAVGAPRTYKAASIQIDAKYNKAGWHFPQHRMFSLWQDVDSFRLGTRPPEPFFFRAHTGDCITYHLVNLVPKEYKMDDFQVRSPTDVIGQHIHLVKFDVTASDGAANGFNYEDGSFSPGETVERVNAIRLQNGCTATDARNGTFACPQAKAHPFFGNGPNNEWIGAQETVQRWYVDDVLNIQGKDRTLRTVFTHDHFGPSTHQQTGLYAGLITEKKGTQWRDPETGVYFGTRTVDGGPTSWRADILFPATPDSSFREFNLQIADFALAYDATATTFPNPAKAINPAGKFEPNPILPFMLRPPVAKNACPVSNEVPPCPELISADDPGTMLVNYRNEPLALRVRDPITNTQASGEAGDLSLAFASDIIRKDTRFNAAGPYRPLVKDMRNGDPFTPLIRVYEDDKVQIRILVGAHEEGHNFSVHGTEWLFEPSDSASGYRNSQMMGISEHFEFVLPPLVDNSDYSLKHVDYLYQGGSATDDLWNGMWGIIRSYRQTRSDLLTLPQNQDASTAYAMAVEEQSTSPMTYDKAMSPSAEFMSTSVQDTATYEESADAPVLGPDGGYGEATTTQQTDPYSGEAMYTSEPMMAPSDETMYTTDPAAASSTPTQTTMSTMSTDPAMSAEMAYAPSSSSSSTAFNGMCPSNAPVRQFDVTAVSAATAVPGGRIVYNSRTVNGGPLYDPSGVLYVFTSDLAWNGSAYVLKAGVPVEPLVMRANAGDCIQVRLRNRLPNLVAEPDGFNTLPMIVDRFNANQVNPSSWVGLHPQLLAYDPARSDGSKVGFNPRTVVRPGYSRDYQWYAGEVTIENGQLVAFPVEYGATNLIPSDRIKHPSKGAIAALIVEPKGATWKRDPGTHSQATVFNPNGTKFREFVLNFQDDVNLRFGSTATLKLRDCSKTDDLEDAERSRCSLYPSGDTTFYAGSAVPNLAEAEDPEDSAQKGLNYRTEPLWFRMGWAPNASLGFTRDKDFRNSLKNSLVGGDPKTPVFSATAGEAVRFRVLQSGGHARNHVFNVHGHAWEEEPYNRNSRIIAANPKSEVKGMQHGHGPTNHFDAVLKRGAGGIYKRTGDYLYRNQASFTFDGGMWGIFRVKAPTTTTCCTTVSPTTAEPTMATEPAAQ